MFEKLFNKGKEVNRMQEENFRNLFIESYEKVIKDSQDYYYRHKDNEDDDSDDLTIVAGIKVYIIFLTSIILVTILIGFDVSLFITFFCLIISVISSIIFNFWYRKNNSGPKDLYKKEVRKLGYLYLSDFENDLEDYVTGENGIYNKHLQELMAKAGIDRNTTILETINNKKYYVWTSFDDEAKKNKVLHLLSTDTTHKPIIENYLFSQIRYYRVDYENKIVIVKLNDDEIIFNENAIVIISSLLPGKEKVVKDNLNEVIKDYEMFISQYRVDFNDGEAEKYYNSLDAQKYIPYALVLLGICVVFQMLPLNIVILENFICFAAGFGIAIFNVGIFNLFEAKMAIKRTEQDIINSLSRDEKCVKKFEELKYSLGIKDYYDKIYSIDGSAYYIWKNDIFIHLFLDEIYFNVIYIVTKTDDIIGYKVSDKECTLKLKNQTFKFNIEAEDVFDKLFSYKKIDNKKKKS